ncbi:helix-turn-helix transcriptional regulator [Enterococcus thailandicus]|uniref:helix-turn-helix transcriptional regulator n=1 Tax=Enterococcus TaxID=1350 RepID=UPI00094D6D81|nr:helix-turn-helix transcriptional regulator [Enterococcus thailandicus]
MAMYQKIKAERLKKELTQEELAEKILVSRQTISNWENQRAIPTTDNIILLSQLFDLPVDYFYSENEVMDSEYLSKRVRKNRLFEMQDLKLWNLALIILLVIALLIPYSAPIALSMIFTWKNKITPKQFKRAAALIIVIVSLDISAMLIVFLYFVRYK